MKAFAILAGLIAGMTLQQQAAAAPFCLDLAGVPLQCLYVDPGTCESEAIRQKGRCVANPDEVKVPPMAAAPYCLVLSGNIVSCVYPDHATCQGEALRRGGACVAAPPEAAPAIRPAPDPFQLKRP